MILTYLPYFDVYTNMQNPIDCRPSDYIVHVFVVRRIYELHVILIKQYMSRLTVLKRNAKEKFRQKKGTSCGLKGNCQGFLYSCMYIC